MTIRNPSAGGGGGGGGLSQAEVDARVALGITDHNAAPDPHPGYLTQTEADALYDQAGTAAGTVAVHVAEVDPHPQYSTQAENDLLYAPLAHDHTGAGESFIPAAALLVANSPGDRKLLSYDVDLGMFVWVDSTEYSATSLNLVLGTHNGGDIDSIRTWNDGDFYNMSEINAATPALDLQITFEDVETFNLIQCQFQAQEGTGSHKIEFGLYNVNTTNWDLIHSVKTTNGFVQIPLSVFNPNNYIDPTNNDRVIVRLYHPLTGAAGHSDQIEWLVLLDSLVGGGGITAHSALTDRDVADSHPATAISASGGLTVQSALDGKVALTRTITTTAPLTGGGDLSANRTLDISNFGASGASHAKGAVPDPGAAAGATKFLREDATWATPGGSAVWGGITGTLSDQVDLQAALDAITGGSVNIKTVEVDFGATPINYGVFTVADGDVTAASNVGVWLSMEAPTGRDADEAEMEPMDCKAARMATGTFDAIVQPLHGPVVGKYKLNYLVG